MTRLLLIGHGRMGKLVEAHAAAHGCEIAGIVTTASADDAVRVGAFGDVDVAVDFSHGPAVRDSVAQLAARGLNVVIGTTGWVADEAEVKAMAARAGIGVLAAANFAIGMHVFRAAVAAAAAKFAAVGDVGAYIHEAHHAAKKDAPSGTALLLRQAMEAAGYTRAIDVSSTRAGSVPGTHTVGFDAPAEAVTLTHVVRDRAVFAHGALEAAKWLKGRRGWFGIDDMFVS
jgi:4-hydroxy-tetrahydrodipicolinate reductase